VSGWYYLLYLEHRTPRWFFQTYLARSRDLVSWELSPANPILTPDLDDGINASDPDLIEFRGRTHLYYSVGDQRTCRSSASGLSGTDRGVLRGLLRRVSDAPGRSTSSGPLNVAWSFHEAFRELCKSLVLQGTPGAPRPSVRSGGLAVAPAFECACLQHRFSLVRPARPCLTAAGASKPKRR